MKKSIIPMLAIIIAISASAFTTVKNNNHKKAAALYWYEVTYDAGHPGGTIAASSDFYVQSEKSQVNSPCDAGTVKDCLRGFASQLTSYPNNAPGTDQIKKPN
jgi:uncharacterized protein YxeA